MVSKKTWILIIAGIVVLAGIVVALVFLLGTPEETKKASDISVCKVSSDNVVGMKIAQGDSVIDLVKTDKAWHYRDDADANIDQGSTESALTMVCYLYAQEKLFDKVDDLSVYGLNPPQMQVAIELNDGSDMAFSFGSYTSGRDGVFMKYSGSDAVYVYDLDSYSILEKAAKAMKDLSIDINAEKLEKIEIMRTSGSRKAMTMVKIPDDKKVGQESWMVTSPFTAIANAKAVSLVTTFFASPRYSAYDGDDVLEEYGFGSSSAYIYLEEADGKSVKIEIGAQTPDGRYYCKEEGRNGVYELASGFNSILEMDMANLIPSTLFPVSADVPSDIDIQAENVSYQLVKKGSQSYTLNNNELPEDTVNALFTYISEFLFQRYGRRCGPDSRAGRNDYSDSQRQQTNLQFLFI